jgi:hypothetical protein
MSSAYVDHSRFGRDSGELMYFEQEREPKKIQSGTTRAMNSIFGFCSCGSVITLIVCGIILIVGSTNANREG